MLKPAARSRASTRMPPRDPLPTAPAPPLWDNHLGRGPPPGGAGPADLEHRLGPWTHRSGRQLGRPPPARAEFRWAPPTRFAPKGRGTIGQPLLESGGVVPEVRGGGDVLVVQEPGGQ